MTYRPILFSGEMVRAILDGRKTQTRRVVKPETLVALAVCARNSNMPAMHHPSRECGPPVRCPYGQPGDRLWVRETFALSVADMCDGLAEHERDAKNPEHWDPPIYRATDDGLGPWRPPIHMPRWASRITLEVTEVRVERLQAISADEIVAEGFQYRVTPGGCPPGKVAPLLRLTGKHPPVAYVKPGETWTHETMLRAEFAAGWDALNAKRGYSWDSNPWVWVVSFRRVDK